MFDSLDMLVGSTLATYHTVVIPHGLHLRYHQGLEGMMVPPLVNRFFFCVSPVSELSLNSTSLVIVVG